MAVVLRRMTSDEFLGVSWPDTVELELSGGEIRVLTKPGPEHQLIVLRLAELLRAYCRATGWGEVFLDTLVKLDPYTSRAPDLSLVRADRRELVGKARLEGPPDVAIEVHSENRAEDEGPKFEEYLRAGISCYWMIDPLSRSLHAYRLQEGRYVLEWQGRNHELFSPSALPGFELPLSRLWSD